MKTSEIIPSVLAAGNRDLSKVFYMLAVANVFSLHTFRIDDVEGLPEEYLAGNTDICSLRYPPLPRESTMGVQEFAIVTRDGTLLGHCTKRVRMSDTTTFVSDFHFLMLESRMEDYKIIVRS